MLDLYRRAIEQIRDELNIYNDPRKCKEIWHHFSRIEDIVIDLEEVVEKAKEIKLVEEMERNEY